MHYDKQELKKKLLGCLDEEIEAALAAAQAAQETASHEGNKPENQYDTLSLEAAYLAHGQSERILQLQQERILLAKWQVAEFPVGEVITTGAVVSLENNNLKRYLWITPCGGRQLRLGEAEMLILSKEAPLAQSLMGLSEGDELSLPGDNTGLWEIIDVV